MNNPLKCFYVYEGDSEYGIAIVACNAPEARKLIWRASKDPESFVDFEGEFIDLRCHSIPCNVTGFELGHIFSAMEGIEHGIYSTIEDTCPVCKKKYQILEKYDEGIMCSDCSDRLDDNVDYATW